MVAIRVENGDVVDRPTDLLVLKHAQHPYGADAAVLEALARDLPLEDMPGPGKRLVVTDTDGIAARRVLFLGVVPLDQLGYREIREFGRRAVLEGVRSAPRALELSMTVHGVGAGLDEVEAFTAQVDGVLSAVEAVGPSSPLRSVVFVERDSKRVARLDELMDDLVPDGRRGRGTTRARPSRTGLDAEDRPHAFVAMPFHEGYDDVFHYGIARPLKEAGLVCERMDQLAFTGDIIDMMRRRISAARLVVAEISEPNPNVHLEVGFAWASGRSVVLLCKQSETPCFDVRGHRYLRWSSIRQLEEQLAVELRGLGIAT